MFLLEEEPSNCAQLFDPPNKNAPTTKALDKRAKVFTLFFKDLRI
jgi:hypothetical protein